MLAASIWLQSIVELLSLLLTSVAYVVGLPFLSLLMFVVYVVSGLILQVVALYINKNKHQESSYLR